MGRYTSTRSALGISLRIAAIGAIALLWPPAAVAQQGGGFDDEVPPPRMVRMHGVVREPDGAPAAGRLIRFAALYIGSPEATTGPDGSYSMEVDLRRPVWAEAWVDGVVRSRFFRVAAPEGAAEIQLDIQLTPPIVMTGTITLPDGRPAADLSLKAEGRVVSGSCGVAGGSESGCAFDLETDDRGRYALSLREGDQTTYDLYISHEGVGCIGPVAIATDIDHPDLRRDFHLTEGGAIEGTVTSAPDGAPLAGAAISVGTGPVHHGHMFIRRATTDEHGRFRFITLPPGRYSLQADFHEDRGDASNADEILWALFRAEPEADEVEVREGRTHRAHLQMVKELVVTGRALGPDGSPLAHATLEGMDAVTDGEGRFVYRIRPRRIFYGEVRLPRDVTLAPRVSGVGVAVPVRLSFLDATPQEADLHLVEPAALTGRASYEGTGLPVAHACLRLSPELEPPGPTRFLDDAGRFEIRDMPPGDYEIAVRDPRILGCPTPPIHVTLRPGQTVGPLELHFPPRPSFRGRVSGIPEARTRALPGGGSGDFGLEAVVAPSGGPEGARVALLDLQPDGTFTAWLPSPPTGRSDVVLRGGFPSPTLRVVSNVIRDLDLAAPSLDLQFHLHPGATIGGRVVVADGVTPLPNVTVRARPVRGDALLLVASPDREYEEAEVPQAYTDEEGAFAISALLPGEYEVSVRWQRDCFGYLQPIHLELAECEQRTDLEFRAACDWP
jgi:protocatechuate 3,4-dioxygenase beta subunit